MIRLGAPVSDPVGIAIESTRVCERCGIPISGRKGKRFCSSKCRDSVYGPAYYEKHKDKRKKAQAEWRSANKERIRIRTKAWNEANKERRKLRDANNKERIKANSTTYRLANKERLREKDAAWYKANKEHKNSYSNKYKKSHPESNRIRQANREARKKESTGRLSGNIAAKLLLLQRWKCAACKKSMKRTGFHLDHIVPLIKGGKNTDSNIQLTCPTCNIKKGGKDPIQFMRELGFLL